MYNYLLILIVSSLPIIEARFGFTFGYKVLEVPVYISMPLAFLGNLISIIVLTYLLYAIFDKQKDTWLHNKINYIVEKIKTRHQKRLENFALLSLLLFVAVPLPFSGSYSGIIIGYLVGLPREKTLFAAAAGTILSLIVVFFTIESVDVSSKFLLNFLKDISLTQ